MSNHELDNMKGEDILNNSVEENNIKPNLEDSTGDIEELAVGLDTLVCNIDLDNLFNKFINTQDYTAVIESIQVEQKDLCKKVEELGTLLGEISSSKRYTYNGNTRVYY